MYSKNTLQVMYLNLFLRDLVWKILWDEKKIFEFWSNFKKLKIEKNLDLDLIKGNYSFKFQN